MLFANATHEYSVTAKAKKKRKSGHHRNKMFFFCHLQLSCAIYKSEYYPKCWRETRHELNKQTNIMCVISLTAKH